MSYRDRSRISGYRSQPVSNRTSLYLSSDFNVGLTEDYTDFDRQFKKLLERTETFTNRVERLQSTSSYLKKGFRGVDSTLTRLRSQRDVIGSSYGNIESRIFNDEGDSTTEEEWKRLLDAGRLIEKAVELVRQRYRYPKPSFEYSPESPSPQAYDTPSGIVLLPNPRSPRDREGKRIRDLGSEIKDHDTESVVGSTSVTGNTNGHKIDRTAPCAKRIKKAEMEKSKSLQSLKEMDEDILVEKPNLRSRLASQKSKEEQSDTESKPIAIDTMDTLPITPNRTIEERRHSMKALMETGSKIMNETTATPPRKSRLLEERRNSTKSLIETTTSISDTLQPTISVTEARNSVTSEDITRPTTTEEPTSSLRSNLSQSTISLYSTDRFKTRSERLKDISTSSFEKPTSPDQRSERSERFKNYSSNTERPRSTAFRSESVFGERVEIESSTSAHEESDDKSKDLRRPSFLKTLKNAASRNKKRPPSSIYEETMNIKREQNDEAHKKNLLSPTDENTPVQRKKSDHLIYTNAELIKMAQEDLEKGKKGKKLEESVTPTLKKKTPSSSSFHEYNPDKRVPLKERLKNKMSETSTSTDDDAISSATPLSQRASRLARDKTTEKDDSLRSRFLRRFRLGSDEKAEEKKETAAERRSRKKSAQDEELTTSSRRQGKQDEDSNISARRQGKHNDEDKKEDEKKTDVRSSRHKEQVSSTYDTYSTRGMKMSMDHRMESIDLEMEKTTSLSEILKKEEENVGVDMSKYSVYSYRSRQRLRDIEDGRSTRSPRFEREKSTDSLSPNLEKQKSTDSRSPLTRQKSSDSLESSSTRRSRTNSTRDENADKHKSRQKEKEEAKKESRTDNKSTMSLRERNRDKDTLKEPKSEFVKDEMPSPKGVCRRLNTTYSFDTEKGKQPKRDITKLDLLDRASLYIKEDVIKPVIKSEEIQVEFKSPRASLSDEVMEQIIESTIIDQPINDDFFKVLLQREVSEEDISIVGATQEESILDNLFEKMNQIPIDSRPTSVASNGKNRESVSSELSIRSCTTSFDESSESSDVFVNGKRSSSSADLFAKIEKANNKLYSGLLSLTSKVKDDGSDTTMHESDEGSNNDKEPKSVATANINVQGTAEKNDTETNVNVNDVRNTEISEITSVQLTDDLLEMPSENIIIPNNTPEDSKTNEVSVSSKGEVTEVTVVEQLKPEETVLDEERFDPSPFKLTRTKKVDDNTPIASVEEQSNVLANSKSKSFDKAVDATTEDVNKMLSNCNSIDKINDDIQRAHTSSTKSSEDLSGNMIDRTESDSPNRKRSSYLEKRASHIKFFQNDLSVSNEDVRTLSDSTKSSKESLDNSTGVDESHGILPNENADGELIIKEEVVSNEKGNEQEIDVVMEKSINNSSVEESVLQEIIDSVEESITFDALTIKTYDDSSIQIENEDETKTKTTEITDKQSTNETNGVDENSDKKRKRILSSSKSLEAPDRIEENKVINKAKMAAMRSTQSVEIKSLEAIRTRLDEIKSHSVTSSLVNVNVVVESKPPAELKSLDEIKNRLNQIKARKKELKLNEINKSMSVDKDAGITPQITNLSITQTLKAKLSDHAESESENDKANVVEDCYEANITLSPIRKIKLSNDFLEETDGEHQDIEGVDVLENGVFDDDINDDKIMTNGHDSKTKLNSEQGAAVSNGIICTAIENDESVVKESIEYLINKIETNNNEDKTLPVTKSEIKNEDKEIDINGVNSPLPVVQDNENNSNGTEIMSESPDKKHDDLSVLNTIDKKQSTNVPDMVEEDDRKLYLNGHSKETLDVDRKMCEDVSPPSQLSDEASNLSPSNISENTMISKTKDTQSSTNGHGPLPKVPKFVFPRQMSIVEYRRQKLEKHPSEPLCASDEEIPVLKSDNDNHKGHKSSVADVSDTSDDCRERKKYYRHSKKEIKSSGEHVRSSASEESDDEDVSIVDRLANRFIQRTRIGSLPNNSISPTTDQTDPSRNKNFSQKFNERFKANGNV